MLKWKHDDDDHSLCVNDENYEVTQPLGMENKKKMLLTTSQRKKDSCGESRHAQTYTQKLWIAYQQNKYAKCI